MGRGWNAPPASEKRVGVAIRREPVDGTDRQHGQRKGQPSAKIHEISDGELKRCGKKA